MQGNDTSLARVPTPTNTVVTIPTNTVATNDNDDLDTESDHNSIDPNKANKHSSKASIHSTRSHAPVHNTTDEPPQHPLEEDELDDIELPELEAQVPVLHQSE